MIDNIIAEYVVFQYARDSINNIPKDEIQFLVSDDTLLDFLLTKIRSKTIAYATMKKKRVNKKEIDLEKDIQKLEKSDKSQEDCMLMNGRKAELKAIREKRTEGVLLRSKARWIAHGEKVTIYFCSLEKRHYISKIMAKLIDKDDNILTDNNDILQEVKSFYAKLCERRDVEDCEISRTVI